MSDLSLINFYMNTASVSKSDDLELGEIPNAENSPVLPNTTEASPAKVLNSPLARLFFDPEKKPEPPVNDSNSPSVRNTSNLRQQSSSNSQDSDSSKVNSARSRSRDIDQRGSRASDEEDNHNKKKNLRLSRKKKPQEGSKPVDVYVLNQVEKRGQEESLQTLIKSQQTRDLQQKALMQQSPTIPAILEVKECHETIGSDKKQDKNINYKLNANNFDRFFKTKMCPQFQAGNCERGLRCTYAHGEKQLRESQTPKSITYKTKTCNNFEKGLCNKKKQDCNYAHGKDDLRLFKNEELNLQRKFATDKYLTEDRQLSSANTSNTITLKANKFQQDHHRRFSLSNKTIGNTEKDINQKYTLNDKQHHSDRTPSAIAPPPVGHYYGDEGNYHLNSEQMTAMHKNMMANGFYGAYFPPGMPFLQGQHQMQQYPPFSEGYPNYYLPYYPCYPPIPQAQMSYYPSFANFPQTSNSATFNSPKTNADYLTAYNQSNIACDSNQSGGRSEKRHGNRDRRTRNDHQSSNNC